MSRRKVEVRREEILDATVEQVQQRGFGSTRVADVAQALGISTGLVFYHFGTKDTLFAAAFEHAADRDLARLDAHRGARNEPAGRGCAACWRSTAPQGERAPAGRCGSTPGQQSLRSQDMRTRAARSTCGGRTCSQASIRAGVAEGCFHCEDPDGAAWRLSALLDGLAVQVIVHRNLTKRQLADWVRGSAARELGIDPSRARSERTASSTSHHPVRLGSPGRSARGGPSRRPRCRASVVPSTTRSVSSRPKVGANLKAWAEPSADDDGLVPGTVDTTKSRSGVSVYWQRCERTGGPTAGQQRPMKPASRSQHLPRRCSERCVAGVDRRAAAVLRRLDGRLAVAVGNP